MHDEGSLTAGYLVAALVASIPMWVLAFLIIGPQGAWAVLVVAWTTLVVWVLKKRQDDAELEGAHHSIDAPWAARRDGQAPS